MHVKTESTRKAIGVLLSIQHEFNDHLSTMKDGSIEDARTYIDSAIKRLQRAETNLLEFEAKEKARRDRVLFGREEIKEHLAKARISQEEFTKFSAELDQVEKDADKELREF